MPQTTPSEFAQAISIIKTSGRSSNGVLVYSTFTLSNETISSEGISMVGYMITDTTTGSTATMTWDDAVLDPANIVASIIT